MKILIAALAMIAIPYSAMAVQYCQEVDPANLDHIQSVVTYVNERDGTSLTVGEFMSETIKKRVVGEVARKIADEAQARVEAESATQEQIAREAAALLEQQRGAIDSTW